MSVVGASADKSGKRREGDRLIRTHGGKVEYEPNVVFCNNKVITSKYNLLTFLPLNLFEQFQNLANLYFLGVGIFQIIPQISTTNGNPTMYQPLAFIVCVSAARAAKEDYDKHVADNKRNGHPYSVLQPDGTWKEVESGDLAVGSIIKVKQNEMIPADMIFLGSALDKGHCFIDKANLNGETTLEVCNSLPQTRVICRNDRALANLKTTLIYEPPNKHFESFRGNLTIHHENGHDQDINLDGKSILLRETNLRNCEWVIGMVVYTGNDTKIQKSNADGEKARMKRSQIMRKVDKYLVWMLLFQIILCFAGGLIHGLMMNTDTVDPDTAWYLRGGDSPAVSGLLAFFSWFILLSQMVPISLIVSSEMVKFIQSIFIQWDIHLFHEPINKPAKCNSSTIHEDLGLVDYVFSDKTGTLTQNKMEFRYALTAFGEYGSKETEIARSVKARRQELEEMRQAKEEGRTYLPKPPTPWTKIEKPLVARDHSGGSAQDCCDCCNNHCAWFVNKCWSQSEYEKQRDEQEEHNNSSKDGSQSPSAGSVFTNEEKNQLLLALWGPQQPKETPQQHQQKQEALQRYMRHMALSNTVKPYEENGQLQFQAESAEELAMVKFAANLGFIKKSINPTVLEITTYNEQLQPTGVVVERYSHVATAGFTSKRARVTVIYQRLDEGPQKGTVYVMTKGQDSVILPLIPNLNETVNEDELLDHLKNMSANGLRTLVAAYSDLPASWWQQRERDYMAVVSRDQTRASEGHPTKCQQDQCEKCAQHHYFEQLEKDANLKYLGCVCMEDQLQLLVPQCIADMLRANIKVWMITGDKLETAKNIGLACNLIDPDMQPKLEPTMKIEEIIEEYRNARLIEITGQWAQLSHDTEQMKRLFSAFDVNQDGFLKIDELKTILAALNITVAPEKLEQLFTTYATIHQQHTFSSNATHARRHSCDGGRSLSFEDFCRLLQSCCISPFDAIKHDIEEGLATYYSIEDHQLYPISLLVDRTAFHVLFPGKESTTAASGKSKSAKATSSNPATAPLLSNASATTPTSAPTEEDLEDLRQKFFQLATASKSVVFARAEPAMKKRMVTEIQARVPGSVTLAIGDGANDVDMITAAHVGVGIAGVEGTGATNSADYAIGTFRMLHNLLFAHGFYNYRRISTLVLFIFYKASLVALCMFYFGIHSAFSGQQFLADVPYQLYNVVYTALPILFVAVLDRVLPYNVVNNYPVLYNRSKGTRFTGWLFFSWILRALVHSVLIFYLPYAALGDNDVHFEDGRTSGLFFQSIVVYICVVFVPTFMILYDMTSVTFLHALSVLASFVGLIFINWLLNVMPSIVSDVYGVVDAVYASPKAWFIILLTVGVVLLLELLLRFVQREFWPSFVQIVAEFLTLSQQEQQQQRQWLQQVKSVPSTLKLKETTTTAATTTATTTTKGTTTDKEKESKISIHVVRRKLRLQRMSTTTTTTTTGEEHKQQQAQQEDQRLRASMIRSILRFRNLTGSQFDSCADARLQQHDQAIKQQAANNNPKPVVIDNNYLGNNNSSRGSFSSASSSSSLAPSSIVTQIELQQRSSVAEPVLSINNSDNNNNNSSSNSNSNEQDEGRTLLQPGLGETSDC